MAADRTFLATTGRGVARAHWDGSRASEVEHLLSECSVFCLAQDPLSPTIIYAGTDSGVLVSADGGGSWQEHGLDGEVIRSLAVSRHEPGRIYAGARPVALRVFSGGAWQKSESFARRRKRWWFSPADAPWSAYVQAIAASPTSDVVLAGIELGAVLRSPDGGRTWEKHRRGAIRDCHTLQFHATQGDWAYQGAGGGGRVSCDGGNSWKRRGGLGRWFYCWAVAGDAEEAGTCYLSASTGVRAHSDRRANARIYRSRDGGRWEALGGGLPQPLSHMPYALLTDRRYPGEVYAGLSNGRVWWSGDGGDRWEALPLSFGSIERTLLLV